MKEWNVTSGLTWFFAILSGVIVAYAFYRNQIDFRTSLEAIAALYYATLKALERFLPK